MCSEGNRKPITYLLETLCSIQRKVMKEMGRGYLGQEEVDGSGGEGS
jgi:hypothetical protein